VNDRQIEQLMGRFSVLRGAWDATAVAEVKRQMQTWADEVAAERTVDFIVQNSDFLPTVAYLRTEYRAAENAHQTEEFLQGLNPEVHVRGGCDGSRWINAEGGSAPCQRCNPVLARIYADQELWKLWRTTGMPTNAFQPGAENTLGACPVDHWHDPAEGVMTPRDGLEVARAAYLADGGTDMAKFDRFMSPLLGKQAPVAPAAKGPSTPSPRSSVLGSAVASPATSAGPGPADHSADT
jgi:hypothetical protein